jgi:hypothetical protein
MNQHSRAYTQLSQALVDSVGRAACASEAIAFVNVKYA